MLQVCLLSLALKLPNAKSTVVHILDPSRLHDTDNHKLTLTTQETETLLPGGISRFERSVLNSHPDLLWLVLTKDEKSWGKNLKKPARSFDDFASLLNSTQLDFGTTSLGLLTSSEAEYHRFIAAAQLRGLARFTAILHPDSPSDAASRLHRQDPQYQAQRRGEIAQLRNYLMLQTLRDEEHIVWLDADVFYLDDGMVQAMIRYANARADVGMVTARCVQGNNPNYDLNAWTGTRDGPAGWELADAQLADAEHDALGQRWVVDLIKDTSDADLVPLNAVGATILYMRAALIWQGLSFPHQYTVGTRWISPGWDGLESEGLCYRARGLEHGGCFVMGGGWHVKHTET